MEWKFEVTAMSIPLPSAVLLLAPWLAPHGADRSVI